MSGGEAEFLDWLSNNDPKDPKVLLGVGDDAAVLQWPKTSLGQPGASPGPETPLVVLAADALAEGSHFLPTDDPELIGRKALAVNLSDLAAMGASPRAALATCALPKGFDQSFAHSLTKGLWSLAAEWDCPLVGGDTVTHEGGLVISVTVIGEVAPGSYVTRSGGRPGDLLAMTGRLGGSFVSGRHLSFTPRIREAQCLLRNGPPTAMMDISDGLLMDAHRLARASGTGFRIDADVLPLHSDASGIDAALSDGEDFELLFAASKEAMVRIVQNWPADLAPVTTIGTLTEENTTLCQGGVERPAPEAGWTHD